MIMNQYFDKGNREEIRRNCPLCEIPLNLEEFKNQNKNEYLSLWTNEKIAILCCKCLGVLEKLLYSDILEIDYPTDRALSWRILNNLTKLGFISEKIRDTEFKDYIEYINNLKQKSIMK